LSHSISVPCTEYLIVFPSKYLLMLCSVVISNMKTPFRLKTARTERSALLIEV